MVTNILYEAGKIIGNAVVSVVSGNSFVSNAAASESVVAAIVFSAYRTLFAATSGSDPLLINIRRTVATLVPAAFALTLSTFPPSAPAVNMIAAEPVPSLAVFAAVILVVVHAICPASLYIGIVFAGILVILSYR